MGTIEFLIPKNMGIDIKIVTLAFLETKLWPNMWFRWRPFWMYHKTRLRGGKNWTPIFLAYLTPNEAIKTIKSILATEMAKMTYRTRLLPFGFNYIIRFVRYYNSRALIRRFNYYILILFKSFYLYVPLYLNYAVFFLILDIPSYAPDGSTSTLG